MLRRIALACMFAAVLAAAPQASAEPPDRWVLVVYMWVDRNNVLSFTDDLKRVPRVYRSAVGQKDVDWKWVSVVKVSSEKQRRQLISRRADLIEAAASVKGK